MNRKKNDKRIAVIFIAAALIIAGIGVIFILKMTTM